MMYVRYIFITFMLAVVCNNEAYTIEVINVTPPFNFFMTEPMLRKRPVGEPLAAWAVGSDDKPVIVSVIPFGARVRLEYPYPLKTVYISLLSTVPGIVSGSQKTYAEAIKYINATPNQFYKFDANILQDGALFYILPTGLSSGLLSGSGPFLSAGVAAPLLIADKNMGAYWNRLMTAPFGVYSGELMKYVYLNKLYAVLNSYSSPAAANAFRALDRTRMELEAKGGISERDAAYANSQRVPGS